MSTVPGRFNGHAVDFIWQKKKLENGRILSGKGKVKFSDVVTKTNKEAANLFHKIITHKQNNKNLKKQTGRAIAIG
jgi:hypothetical protein